jgi:transcriptional regulator with XRE-family HTH domain
MQITTSSRGIRARRLVARLTQLELAERAGCSVPSVRLFELGYLPERSEALERVLAALDEAEAEMMAAGFRLEPNVGVSGYRGDTDAPETA